MSSALIVEGGAMRGIFSCGILDSFLEQDYAPFDLCIGVSAGANNLSGYLAGMYQRNYRIYTDYSRRKEFINWRKYLTGGHLIDIDWLWEISIREIPLDVAAILRHPAEFFVGVTRVDSGEAEYLTPQHHDMAELLRASSAVPLLYRSTVQLNGAAYIDGGIADPIPAQAAVQRGADSILVLRSRPRDYRMPTGRRHRLSRLALRRYPNLVTTIMNRALLYNRQIAFIRNPPPGIRITEINPPPEFATDRLTTDLDTLERDYGHGREIGRRLAAGLSIRQ